MGFQEHNQALENERNQWYPFVFWLFAIVLLVGIDQGVKYFIFSTPTDYLGMHMNRFFDIVQFRNYQFAFSLPVPAVLMYLVYASILGSIYWYLYKQYRQLPTLAIVAWGLILGGAFSNIGERIIYGYVKDFIYIFGGGILNIADLYIFLGVGLLLYKELKKAK